MLESVRKALRNIYMSSPDQGEWPGTNDLMVLMNSKPESEQASQRFNSPDAKKRATTEYG